MSMAVDLPPGTLYNAKQFGPPDLPADPPPLAPMKLSLSPPALLGAAALGLFLALPGSVRAVVIAYTDPAMYAAASANNTTHAFSGGTNSGISEGSTYTNGPITFSITSGEYLYLLDEGIYGAGVSYLRADNFSGNLMETLTLASPVTAVAFTLGTYNGAASVVAVNGTTAYTFNGSSSGPGSSFVGFTSTVPIASLTFSQPIQPGVSAYAIDTISFQTGSAVPEPSTWALLGVGAGLLGLCVVRRRTA